MSIRKEEGREFVRWFSELSNKDIAIAGGKGASLAEMYRNKFPIPPGFVITAQSYSHFIESSNLGDKIDSLVKNIDIEDTEELNKASEKIREIINKASLPKDMEDAIIEA